MKPLSMERQGQHGGGAVLSRLLVAGVWSMLCLRAVSGELRVSPNRISASFEEGRRFAPPAGFTISCTPDVTGLSYGIHSTVGWLDPVPASGLCGPAGDAVAVEFRSSEMAAGTYTGLLTCTSAEADNPPQEVEVILHLTPESTVIRYQPPELTFTMMEGSTNVIVTLFEVWNGGSLGGGLEYAIDTGDSWLSVSPTSGISHGEVQLHTLTLTNLAGLSIGPHLGSFTISDRESVGPTIPVTLTVRGEEARATFTPDALVAATTQGVNASPLQLRLGNAGGEEMPYRVAGDVPWLSATPSQAVVAARTMNQLVVDFETTELPAGSFRGHLLFYAPTNLVVPHVIPVELTVAEAASVPACTKKIFQQAVAGSGVHTQTLAVWNAGGGSLAYTLEEPHDWLTVSPTSGVSNGETQYHQVLFSTINQPEGRHTGAILLRAPGATPPGKETRVSFQVDAAIGALPTSISNSGPVGEILAPSFFELWNAGSSDPIGYGIAGTAPWLAVSPTSGVLAASPSLFTIAYSTADLPVGVYREVLEISSATYTQQVPVELRLCEPAGEFIEGIVFVSDRGGDRDLWVIDPSGAGLAPLVEKPGAQDEPEISPDGTMLAYADFGSGTRRLVLRHLVGGVETEHDSLESVRWLPDSSGVFGRKPGDGKTLWLLSRTGTFSRMLTEREGMCVEGYGRITERQKPAAGTNRFYYSAYADGALRANSIKVEESTETRMRRAVLQGTDSCSESGGRLSPNGRYLLYAKNPPLLWEPFRIYLFDLQADAERERPLSSEVSRSANWPDFSPLGDRVVFSRSAGARNQLVLVDLATSNEAVILSDAHLNTHPSWGVCFRIPRPDNWLEIHPPGLTNIFPRGSAAEVQSVVVSNAGRGWLSWSISNDTDWVWTSASAGTGTGNWEQIEIGIRPEGLATGTHTGKLAFAANASNAPQDFLVVAVVEDALPALSCDTTNLSCHVNSGGTAGKRIAIWNRGGRTLSYAIASNRPWLSAQPSSGTSTGEVDAIDVQFNAGLYSAGVYTGLLTVASVEASWQIPVQMTVQAANTNPPLLAVSPPGFTNSTTRYRNAPEQSFAVWNNGGQTLEYHVSEDVPWLGIVPLSGPDQRVGNRGERDGFTLRYDNIELGPGLYATNFHVLSSAGTQTLSVALDVLPPLQYELAVSNTPGGRVTRTPDAAFYTEGTPVTLNAWPSNGYMFRSWTGNAAGSTTQTVVRMDGEKNVRAIFTNATRVWGHVTNLLTGAAISNVAVCIAGHTNQTDAAGHYSIQPPDGWGILAASRTGYDAVERGLHILAYTSTRCDLGLMPDMVSGVRALQRPGAKRVDIFYVLSGLSADRHDVALSLSADGGRTWDVPACSQFGDHGSGIRPSAREKQIVWDAGVCWGGRRTEQMRAGLVVAGRRFESGNFNVDTRSRRDWRVRVWADKNGNAGYDVGEELEGADVHYGFVRTGRVTARTDAGGYATVPGEAVWGENLFARKNVYSRPAAKTGHAAVDGIMYRLFLDNHIGGRDESLWDGTWRGYTLTSADLTEIDRGRPVFVRLQHPVFEWNLLVAYEGSSTDTVRRLQTGFQGVSTRLYDITDGQMKLGKVRIRSNIATNESQEWDEADVHIFDNTSQGPQGDINGIYSADGGHVRLGRAWEQLHHIVYPPDHSEYIKAVSHELGHYLLNFSDEYLPGAGTEEEFETLRASNTNDYPSKYGLMQGNTTELSSCNDYLAAYPAGVQGTTVTRQIWNNDLDSTRNFYPCWQWLERTYESNYAGYRVGITVPQYGTFVNGLSTSPDRDGPLFIPTPYVDCVVFTTSTLRAGAKMNSVPAVRSPVLRVAHHGAPVAGARVALIPAGEDRPRILGKTRHDGRMEIPDVWAGDVLTAFHEGHAASRMIAVEDAGQTPIDIELLDPRDPRQVRGLPLSTNRLGIVATGALVSSNEWDLHLQVSLPLVSNPVVRIYPDGEGTSLLVLSSGGGLAHTGRVPFADRSSGLLQIEASPTNQPLFSTLDAYMVCRMDADRALYWSRDGRAEISFTPGIVTNHGSLLVYQGHGPVILSTNLAAIHQVGPMLYFALSDPAPFAEGEEAWISIHYLSADIVGLDESSIRLFRWDGEAWGEVPSGLSMAEGVVSATLANLGAYVLLARETEDMTPPAAVTDLVAATGSGPGEIQLVWTAPGDDNASGTAAVYDLRYSPQDIAEGNWHAATPVRPFADPMPAGTPQSHTIQMAVPDALYYFALCARDEAGNAGALAGSTAARAGMTDANEDGIPDDWLASVNLGRETPMGAGEDVDNDGLTTWDEYDAGTDPGKWDTDGDGMSDGWEHRHGLNPLDPEDADEDADGDGIGNLEEYGHGTNPQLIDTDGDGIADLWEIQKGQDPLTDAEDEGAENDPDGDTFSNFNEFIADTWPRDSTSYLRISGAIWQDGARITFPCSTARLYGVEWTPGLEPGREWQTLLPPGLFYGPGETVTITNPGATGGMYRIRVQHP